jgi:hypothetical protein
MTEQLQKLLEEKQKRLSEISVTCSEANCAGHQQTARDVNRMQEFEELEEEIRELKNKLAAG